MNRGASRRTSSPARIARAATTPLPLPGMSWILNGWSYLSEQSPLLHEIDITYQVTLCIAALGRSHMQAGPYEAFK